MIPSEGDPPSPQGPRPSSRIRSFLQDVLQDLDARMVLLAERGGGLLSTVGNPGGIDTVALASISAAHFGAGSVLASTVGDKDFSALLHQGEETSVYLHPVGGGGVAVVLFDGVRNPQRVIRAGEPTLRALGAEVDGALAARGPRGLSPGWAEEAQAEIERIFRHEG